MRLWLLTRRVTHLPEKGDRIRGEALHLAPQSCGFRLLRFTLQLQTPNIPHMHFLAQPVQASIPSDFFHSRNWGHPTAAGQSTVALVYVERTLHQTILRIRVRILTWRCTIRSLKAELHQQALRPSFLTLSAVSFLSIFSLLLHFCFWTFFVSDLWFFLICIFALSPPSSFWKFFFVRHECLFVGPFLFHVFFFFPCVPPCFSLLVTISHCSWKNLLVSCLFCLCHFPSVSISPQNISFLLLSFFFFPFFYSAYFLMSSFFSKKIQNRIKWEMA